MLGRPDATLNDAQLFCLRTMGRGSVRCGAGFMSSRVPVSIESRHTCACRSLAHTHARLLSRTAGQHPTQKPNRRWQPRPIRRGVSVLVSYLRCACCRGRLGRKNAKVIRSLFRTLRGVSSAKAGYVCTYLFAGAILTFQFRTIQKNGIYV